MKKSKGSIDGRPTERTTTSETFVMPGTKGGVSMKLNKHVDIEYALPKETQNRQRIYKVEAHFAPIDRKEYEQRFDLIDWSK